MIVVGLFKDSLALTKTASFCLHSSPENLQHAPLLLNHAQEPNSFLWNSVIRGYEQRSDPWEAIHVYCRMSKNGVLPDKFTFPFVLKACANVAAITEGEQIHGRILKSPYQVDVFVECSVIYMYAKCQRIDAARASFDSVPYKNVFCWNNMIDGYVKDANVEAACQLFDRMPGRDLFSWNVMIDGLSKCGRVDDARTLFDAMPARDVVSWNSMICGYTKCGNVRVVRELFDEMSLRDAVTWTTMIDAYVKHGNMGIAHCLFEKMPHKSLITWNSMIDGYAKCGDIKAALMLFELMPQKNMTSWNVMLYAYVKCGRIEDAREWFDEMQFRDMFSWNILIDGYVRLGCMKDAQELFEAMPYRDVITWNVMIAGYNQNGYSKEAINLFHRMQMVGENPDASTLAIVLSAIADLGLFVQGRWIHTYINRNNFSLDSTIGVALIDMYSKCGHVDIALGVFNGITHKTIDHWNSMISGLALHGCAEQALCLFEEMQRLVIEPDDITFIGVLSACSHAGLVCEGRRCFKLMRLKYRITPKIQHYGCMVDLLSRAGHLEEAKELVLDMPMRPNDVIWRALLSASRNHGNIEIGEQAAKHLIDLEPHDTSSYVLLSNIYGATERWESAMEMREMMKGKGIVKIPGCSSIEINGTVHEFIAGDTSHPRITEIYLLLNDMNEGLVLAGYTRDMRHLFFDIDV
ncbi:pentatricopeptide repeat-containing protein At2g45350, chloroplastic-like [Magnolia sinica]|uniref:pentatricopeptide repeat-containing protein At2g45350, chloroplastic-like n=1 Tax=Magnolia sinica TaxID=86752 RepID=UPI002658A683|nr:pentatricopeptide repeat-containing protein At2g45350, chloroplastic-like [Magnolia sinica]